MIHIYRANAFGDVLWTEPVVRYLVSKNQYVNVITNYPEVFQNYPSPYLVLNKPVPKWKRNILKVLPLLGFPRKIIKLDMAYEKTPKIHVLKAYFNAAGIKEEPLSLPKLYLTEEEKKRTIPEKYAVLHIDKNPLNHRNAYGVDWKEVVNFIQGLGLKVIQISKQGEDLYGEWYKTRNMREVMSLVYHASLFIGLDSGPSHIAGCFQIPSAIFFGSVNPRLRHLNDKNKIYLQQPCEYAGCYHEVVSSRGKECQLAGSEGIPKCSFHTTEYVINAIKQLYTQSELSVNDK
jgi:ADP-heptose:LPS heptosyltransferase